MTPTPLAEAFLHQADETPEIAAIREALAAGPTPGPWIAGNDDDSDRFLIGPEELPGIVCRPVVSLHAEKDADYIAACNPAAITAVLAHFDAALKARDAEIARLRDDARRYQWLRDEHEARDSGETFCVFEPDYGLHCLNPVGSMPGELDAAIDAALQSREGKGVGDAD